MGKPRPLTPNELQNGWLQVDTSMRLAFSVYLWNWTFAPGADAALEFEAPWMGWAALISTLISLRSLDSFFGTEGRKDDMLASHWPGPHRCKSFLTDDERDNISKIVAHHTVRQLTAWQVRFDARSMTERAFKEYERFASSIRDGYFAGNDEMRAQIDMGLNLHRARLDEWLSKPMKGPGLRKRSDNSS
jgi:hypothetical protein